MSYEKQMLAAIAEAKARSLSTGEPFPAKSALARSLDFSTFQAPRHWPLAHQAYNAAAKEVKAAQQPYVGFDQVSALVNEITHLWTDYIQQEGPKGHPYSKCMNRLRDLLQISDYNEAIDWLDLNYPNWRGYIVEYPCKKDAA